MKNLKVKTINYLFVLFVLFLTINVGISESKKDNLHSINSKIYYVGTIAVSPDGSKLASGSTDGTIKIWNTTSKSVMKTITINSSYSTDTFYSPYFITNDPRTQQSLLFSDNGTTLLVALTLISTNTIDLVQYDVNTGEELKSFPIESKFLSNSPNNDEIFVKSRSNGIIVYNLLTGDRNMLQINETFGNRAPNFILYTNNNSVQPNKLIYDTYNQSCAIADNSCQAGLLHIGQTITLAAHKNYIYTATLNQKETKLVTLDINSIKIWDLTSCSATECGLITSIPISLERGGIDNVRKVTLAISPDDTLLVFSLFPYDEPYGSIIYFDLVNNKSLFVGKAQEGFSALFTQDGKNIAYFDNNSVNFMNVSLLETTTTTITSTTSTTSTTTATSINYPVVNPSASMDPLIQIISLISMGLYVEKKRKKS